MRQQERVIGYDRLWEGVETLRDELERSNTLEEARMAVMDCLHEIESEVLSNRVVENRLEYRVRLDAIHILKDFIAPDSEALTGHSTLEILWDLARSGDEGIGAGFMQEVRHLFAALQGRSGMGTGWMARDDEMGESFFDDLPLTGHRAAVRRSRVLDEMGRRSRKGMDRFACGLDEPMRRERSLNRSKILDHFGAAEDAWYDWEWQAKNILKGIGGVRTLEALVPLAPDEKEAIREAVRVGIPWGITPFYLSMFDFTSSDRTRDGQVRSQVMPTPHLVRSMISHKADRSIALDFMGEHSTSPIDRVTRRYPHIAILKACGTCPQICSYCQRNWEIDDAMVWDRLPSREDLDPALDWFAEHEEILDVLVTGGDPLILSDDVLFHVLDRLARLPHVRHIRIGTRVPVTMPMRITDALAERLSSYVEPGRRNVSVVTHVESAYEVTPELAQCVARLKRHGIPVLNQLVFTVQTSRRFQTMATRIALNRAGIIPYYTFYTKGKSEHRDYLVPIARILQERKEEARLLPGIMRTDEPVFNVPRLGKHHLRARQDREWIGLRRDGRRIYLFHPWEKGIAPVEPWVYEDVPIHKYLQRMQALGEDTSEYASIWYYS